MHIRTGSKKPAQQNPMKGIFVHKFGDLSANCENKLCAHTDSLEFLCTLLQVVPHQNFIINQTIGINIYICQCVSVHLYFSWDFFMCVYVGSFEELNLNMLENNTHKNMCKFCIDDDDDDDDDGDDSWELVV